MRIFTGIVIKLFLVLCFLFSFNSHAKWVGSYSAGENRYPTGLLTCEQYFKKQFTNAVYIEVKQCIPDEFPLTTKTTSWASAIGYTWQATCPSGTTTPDYPSTTCKPLPPECNSDQILNPETNTCDARCTAPDVWDPVTQQCVTEKNRCDLLGQRQPVVEVDWRQSSLGSSFVGQYSCMPSGCVVTGTKDIGCLSDNDRCYGDAKYTGTQCTYTEGVTSGWCSDETCSDQTPVEPVPDPDNPNPEPPSPNPDPTPGDGFTPPNPDTSADPNNPNLQEEGNKGVVNELNTANKTLENIEKTLKTTLDEITAQNKDVDKANDKLILGIQNLAKAVSGAGSSGGGGGGDGDHVGDADVASFNCDAETFQCKGDVIQCLSAEIQFKEHCINSELKQLETSFKKIASVDNVKAIVQDEEIDLSKIDTKYLTGSGLSVSGQCPPPYTFTVDVYKPVTITIPLADLCAAVQRFAPLIILFGWVSGIGLIGRQQGVF